MNDSSKNSSDESRNESNGNNPEELVCVSCSRALELIRTDFTYMGYEFHESLPRCPQCGQVYVSPQLARSRMREVESAMEDK